MNRKDRRRQAKAGVPAAQEPAGAPLPGGFGAGDAFAFLAGARPAPPPVPVVARPRTKAPPPSTTPSDKSPYRGLFVAIQNRVLDALRTSRSVAVVARAVADSAALSDRTWNEIRPAIESRRQPNFACAAGCSWCCHQQVALEPVEAIAIARHVETHFTAGERAAVKQRIDALAERTRGLGNLAWARLKTPCAFLIDGKCSIYEVRPLRCRAVYSRDAEHCRWAMESPDEYFGHRERRLGSGPYPIEPRHIVDAALTGLAVAARDFGLSWKTLTFMAAMKILLDQPDAAQRYLAGEPVFATALLPDDEDAATIGAPSPAPSSHRLAKSGDSA
mgnify:CR=1 FL=1